MTNCLPEKHPTLKCPKCSEPIIYADRWYKKCLAGHVSPLTKMSNSSTEKAEIVTAVSQYKRYLSRSIRESTKTKQHGKEVAFRDALAEFLDLFEDWEDI